MSKSTSSVRNLLARQKAQIKQREAEDALEEKRKAARIAEEEKAREAAENAEKENEEEILFTVSGPIPGMEKIIAAYTKKFPDSPAGIPLHFASDDEAKQFFEEMAKLGECFLFEKRNADGTPADQFAVSVGDGTLIFGNHVTVVAALSAYKEDSPHYETAQTYLKSLGAQPQKTTAFRDALQAEREPLDATQSGPKVR
ncbi:hypothetical protein Lgee_1364 [Legionella geestiana]|uniref:Uncharacterized protein n=1 Tax=Legionella geestiana TaxID=45065 RepID=A0A0W0TTS1_9GAMM|nr:hypothetical protein [Legionella geestiana]KTC98918.1 hypothetical protein Lgee_1364 [Legionella geestiana]QBS13010.1 hypothetical protein E4T54_09825 [Legionella geestiana]QDQ39313.1 hypothetical protein E3226_002255 [Legionella geestiana]STX54481.1 Uncharacterised protein [Legionella geestiana]